MSNELLCPLTADDLVGAAFLCLRAAAFTDLSQLVSNENRREHHARRQRFEKAQALVKDGVNSPLELPLKTEDYLWAAEMSQHARDSDGWLLSFKLAASIDLQARIRKYTDLFDREYYRESNIPAQKECLRLEKELCQLDRTVYLSLKIERLEKLVEREGVYSLVSGKQEELEELRAELAQLNLRAERAQLE